MTASASLSVLSSRSPRTRRALPRWCWVSAHSIGYDVIKIRYMAGAGEVRRYRVSALTPHPRGAFPIREQGLKSLSKSRGVARRHVLWRPLGQWADRTH